uniref:RING-type domain-containing protein n=1 Tax=Palpitomonas bilix TaxID=652834 RepID=A0A7S3G5F5_9EUKA|mmetsp:Transcript_20450/g.52478  ORF Transcript_20450/g.52478 Transcript_20450/m.52478 type:complete len:684 (+) Transcript_20450:278-2329(+)
MIEQLQALEGERGRGRERTCLNLACFVPESRLLIGSTAGGKVEVWQRTSDRGNEYKLMQTLQAQLADVTCIVCSSTGSTFVTGSGTGEVSVWERERGRGGGSMAFTPFVRIAGLPLQNGGITSLCVCEDEGGNIEDIVLCTGTSELNVWRLKKREWGETNISYSRKEVINVPDVAATAVEVVQCTNTLVVGTSTGKVHLYRRENSGQDFAYVHALPENEQRRESGVTAIAVDQSHNRIAVGEIDGTTTVWRASDPLGYNGYELSSTFSMEGGAAVRSVRMSEVCPIIITAVRGGKGVVWAEEDEGSSNSGAMLNTSSSNKRVTYTPVFSMTAAAGCVSSTVDIDDYIGDIYYGSRLYTIRGPSGTANLDVIQGIDNELDDSERAVEEGYEDILKIRGLALQGQQIVSVLTDIGHKADLRVSRAREGYLRRQRETQVEAENARRTAELIAEEAEKRRQEEVTTRLKEDVSLLQGRLTIAEEELRETRGDLSSMQYKERELVNEIAHLKRKRDEEQSNHAEQISNLTAQLERNSEVSGTLQDLLAQSERDKEGLQSALHIERMQREEEGREKDGELQLLHTYLAEFSAAVADGAEKKEELDRRIEELKKELEKEAKQRAEMAEKAEEEAQAQKRECAVCFTNEVDHALVKCGHMFCSDCANELKSRGDNCPNCRQPISAVIRVFS